MESSVVTTEHRDEADRRPEFVPGATPDLQAELLAQLRDLVPSAFIDGQLDRDALLTALDLDGNERQSSFSFSWPGDDQARSDARRPTTATLVPDRAASLEWDEARDVLIEGDNLQVLKLLKNGYSQAVKLIYIDPPYNTGETFTYDDKFAIPETRYLTETGQLDRQGNAMTSRIESGGRKHAPWLTMMFPRLVLARHLLRRDGAILVSIDNNEVHHLRLLLDAIFGAGNFVDMMTWSGTRKGNSKMTGGGQDYILIYARDLAYLKRNDVRWRERKEGLDPIYAKVAELRSQHDQDYASMNKAMKAWYKSLPADHTSKNHDLYDLIDTRGIYRTGDISTPGYRPNLMYDWHGYAMPANGWRHEKAKMQHLHDEDRLFYPDSKDKQIQLKRYLHEHEEWSPASVFDRARLAASTNLEKLMGKKIFDNPKSTDVLARLFHAITDDGDLILDFFAGSGSTGHAVWEQNPKDGKTRNWILVQLPEAPNDSERSGKNAIAAGYETIFEITAERLRRAAQRLQSNTAQLGSSQPVKLGFRIFRARPTNLNIEPPVIASPKLTGQTYLEQVLAQSEKPPVSEGARAIDVAWEVALKTTATRLDALVSTHQLSGVDVYEFKPSPTYPPPRNTIYCKPSANIVR